MKGEINTFDQANLFKICFVDFTNDNGPIIKLLTDRGNAIREYNFKEVEKLNNEILTYKNDKELKRKHRRPISCFITFMYPDGKKIAEDFI